jgi:hypothetical protein
MELLNQGRITATVLFGGALAFVLGFILLVLYKRTLDRHMRTVAAGGNAVDHDDYPRHKPTPPLTYKVEQLGRTERIRSPVPAPFDSTLGFAAVYSLAGLVFAIVATVLLFACSGIQFLPLRTVCVVWAYAWPIVITLNLLWSSDRRRQLGVVTVYIGAIALLCLLSAFSGSRPSTVATITFPALTNPILLWGMFAAPSLFLLLFLNRTVRAVGPVLLIFGSLVFLGWQIATVLLGTSVGMQAVGWVFASTAIGAEPLWRAVNGAGLAIGAVLGWLVIGRVADAYAARRFSEQMLIVDTIWFLQALMLCSDLGAEVGYWGVAGLFPFAAYKIATILGFRALSAKLERQPLRLLLLRVFGFSRRSSRLMDLIAARWRYIGNIFLIAAPDLASRTIEPGKLLAFLRRRLGRLFVHDRTELARRLAAIDETRDPDGRFRIAELFCAGDVWRAAVISLMNEAQVTVMDVRGFGPEHQGCVFELQTLLDTVPLERLVLLIDAGTKIEFLKQVLDVRWRQLRDDSPNAQDTEPTVRLIEVNGSESRVVRQLMRAADAIARAASPRNDLLRPDHAQTISASSPPRTIVTST